MFKKMTCLTANGFAVTENISTIVSLSSIVPLSSKKPPFSLLVTKKLNGKTIYLVPRQYEKNYNINSLDKGHSVIIKCIASLRDYQIEAVNAVIKNYEKSAGSILEMGCGTGKTITALAVASILSKKTLIVVDKKSLAEQWAIEIQKYCGIQANLISQTKTITDCPISIIINKSLITDRYKWQDFISFGLVILDEVHTYATESALKIFWKISRRYLLGLTATLNRKDGLEKILKWFIGDIIFTYHQSLSCVKPIIYAVKYNAPKKYSQIFWRDNQQLDVIRMYKQVMIDDPQRIDLIIKISKWAKEMKKKIMIICIFRKQVDIIFEALGECKKIKIYSQKKQTYDLNNYDFIVGTRNICAQSINIPDLNCLILASSFVPNASDIQNSLNLQQLIGRVLRKQHNEAPIIFDIVDSFSFFVRQWHLRQTWYKQANLEIRLHETK